MSKFDSSFYLRSYLLARQGKTNRQIAKSLEIDPDLFDDWICVKPCLREAVSQGREECKSRKISRLCPDKEQRAFLAAYGKCGNITKAAEKAVLTREMHYHWMQFDANYREAFRLAEEEAGDRLEATARLRAEKGLRRYKFTKSGEPILHPITGEPYYEHVYSDALMAILLKAAKPDKYKERTQTELTGADGGPLLLQALTQVEAERKQPPVVDGNVVRDSALALAQQNGHPRPKVDLEDDEDDE